MPDISLLPDEARKKEREAVASQKGSSGTPVGGLKMHIPEAEVDEDIEIIEVDEGDLGAVLADEPFLTRFMYRASAFVDTLRQKMTNGAQKAPPPKLPPQFFTPPSGGKATLPPGAAAAMSGGKGASGAPRARITPSAEVPRRVRVIKRHRKPVQVSLISTEDVLAYRIDIGKRQWTLAVLIIVFAAFIGGGYWLLTDRIQAARATVAELDRQMDETVRDIDRAEGTWSAYRDLQRRLTALGDLLDEHVVVSRAFDLLESRTLPNVAYRGATLSGQERLSLDAVADSYSSAARQLVSFRQSPFVRAAESTSFTAQIDGETGEATLVSFQLLIDLDGDALRGPAAAEGSATAATMP